MKIFCVYLCNYKDKDDYFISLMPYGITSIASYLESINHEVILANLSSFGYGKGVELTLLNKPEIVAISIFSFNRDESFKYIRELKKKAPDIIIVAGGQHPTFLHDEILKRYEEIDYIISGEGETAVEKLISKIHNTNNKIISEERISDLNSLPFPGQFNGKTIGVNSNEQFKYIITSRGCPGSCTYCSSPAFWKKKVTFRSGRNIIDELTFLRERYGIIYFSIRDDNFTLNKKRVMEFCNLIEKNKLYMMWNCQARVDSIDSEMLIAMKCAGLEHIQFGIESGSERMLRSYDKSTTPEMIIRAAKLTRDIGIYLSFYLMTGMHGETARDIKDTVELIRKTLPHDSIVSPVAYYPGTSIYNKDKASGIITDDIWFKNSDSGIFIQENSLSSPAINRILHENIKISGKAQYRLSDIKKHKDITGNSCWLNEIIKGDIYLMKEDYTRAASIFKKVIKEHPENIWGYLRFSESVVHYSPSEAVEALISASTLVPNNYEVWYRLAVIYKKLGNKVKATESSINAYKLNPFDTEVNRLYKKLKS